LSGLEIVSLDLAIDVEVVLTIFIVLYIICPFCCNVLLLGVTGPIIVHPKEPEPFEYDDERMLFLQDFYIQTSIEQDIGLQNYPFTWVGNPNSLLINGKGLASRCVEDIGDDFGDANVCLVDTCNDTLAWTPTISVDAGKTYRFRMINRYDFVLFILFPTAIH
jgi:FtsP/CotA-like multicopper oxidase with cupredoxin domain